MENNKSDLELYREKRDKVYTFAEIKEAFDNSFVACFDVDKEKINIDRWSFRLFSGIWEINPDAIIKEADLCMLTGNPTVKRKQILVINKNGTRDSVNEIGRFIESTGFVSEAFFFSGEKKDGVKKCYRNVFGSSKPAFINKGNLLSDGDNLLVTVRTDIRPRETKLSESGDLN